MPDQSVEAIVAEVLELSPEQITDETGPATEGRWTSLTHLKIISQVQKHYTVTFAPREIRSVRTVGALRELIAHHQNP